MPNVQVALPGRCGLRKKSVVSLAVVESDITGASHKVEDWLVDSRHNIPALLLTQQTRVVNPDGGDPVVVYSRRVRLNATAAHPRDRDSRRFQPRIALFGGGVGDPVDGAGHHLGIG